MSPCSHPDCRATLHGCDRHRRGSLAGLGSPLKASRLCAGGCLGIEATAPPCEIADRQPHLRTAGAAPLCRIGVCLTGDRAHIRPVSFLFLVWQAGFSFGEIDFGTFPIFPDLTDREVFRRSNMAHATFRRWTADDIAKLKNSEASISGDRLATWSKHWRNNRTGSQNETLVEAPASEGRRVVSLRC